MECRFMLGKVSSADRTTSMDAKKRETASGGPNGVGRWVNPDQKYMEGGLVPEEWVDIAAGFVAPMAFQAEMQAIWEEEEDEHVWPDVEEERDIQLVEEEEEYNEEEEKENEEEDSHEEWGHNEDDDEENDQEIVEVTVGAEYKYGNSDDEAQEAEYEKEKDEDDTEKLEEDPNNNSEPAESSP
ncbi:proline-, glutamic acid- and leucine-rich protein 1-like [Sciurus carolinensis]|uniref:proline-, glutamic acid- and leucine-rich protein 1-like n=1 Tax=Sciurus carolinensis TaxID=30640 RepID=UPI001FB3F8FA|nr:proline-, glutamic acid- and leucine-rich protein 1-like [Sciurus carolinensis]